MTPPYLIKCVVWKKKRTLSSFRTSSSNSPGIFSLFRHAESVWILRHKKCIIDLDIKRIELRRDATRALIVWHIRKYIYNKKECGFPTLFILPILIVLILIPTFRNAVRRKILGFKGQSPFYLIRYPLLFSNLSRSSTFDSSVCFIGNGRPLTSLYRSRWSI